MSNTTIAPVKVVKAEDHGLDPANGKWAAVREDGATVQADSRAKAREVNDAQFDAAKAAEAEALAGSDQARDVLLEALRQAATDGNKEARNALIVKGGNELGIPRKVLAEAGGISPLYIQRIFVPIPYVPKGSLSKYAQGYQQALADVLAAMLPGVNGGNVEAAGQAGLEWIDANRSDKSSAWNESGLPVAAPADADSGE